VPFNIAGRPTWLQVRLLEPARPDARMGPRGTIDALLSMGPAYAREIYHMLNIKHVIRLGSCRQRCGGALSGARRRQGGSQETRQPRGQGFRFEDFPIETDVVNRNT